MWDLLWCWVFLQAEDGIRSLVRSRGLGDVYKRQPGILLRPGPGQVHPCIGTVSVLYRF